MRGVLGRRLRYTSTVTELVVGGVLSAIVAELLVVVLSSGGPGVLTGCCSSGGFSFVGLLCRSLALPPPHCDARLPC